MEKLIDCITNNKLVKPLIEEIEKLFPKFDFMFERFSCDAYSACVIGRIIVYVDEEVFVTRGFKATYTEGEGFKYEESKRNDRAYRN